MKLDFDIVAFIKEIADRIKDKAVIDSYIDNNDGTYTILTSDTKSLETDPLRDIGVELINFGSLSGKYLTSNVVVDTSFDIIKEYVIGSGLVDIEIGQIPVTTTQATTTDSGYQTSPYWESITPTFFHGEKVLVNQKVDNYPTELNKYPCIVLDEALNYQLIEQTERSGWLDMQTNNISISFCNYIGYADNDIELDDFRNKAINEMRELALLFMAELKNYDSEFNQIDIQQIKASFLEFKNTDYWDFSPTGVNINLSFLLQNVYNICK